MLNYILYIYVDISHRFNIKSHSGLIIYFVAHYSNCGNLGCQALLLTEEFLFIYLFDEVIIIHWRLILIVYRLGLPSLGKVLKYKYTDTRKKYIYSLLLKKDHCSFFPCFSLSKLCIWGPKEIDFQEYYWYYT